MQYIATISIYAIILIRFVLIKIYYCLLHISLHQFPDPWRHSLKVSSAHHPSTGWVNLWSDGAWTRSKKETPRAITPCSTRRPSLVISDFKFWMVSLALCSFSCDASRGTWDFFVHFLEGKAGLVGVFWRYIPSPTTSWEVENGSLVSLLSCKLGDVFPLNHDCGRKIKPPKTNMTI